ncbi:hypothetical protein [Anabaena sp. PCC 7108]|uniref:hypothetical protein n=1 Tax=Anabaena sp. PCC 7108 TaxID=163908 RepID=UPI00034D3469|nr:hypothetical protein [Anabaena sp. PCC 7108]
MSQNEVNPAENLEEDELSLEELEAQAGGTGEDYEGLILKIDSSYTSYVGAKGTKGHEVTPDPNNTIEFTFEFP